MFPSDSRSAATPSIAARPAARFVAERHPDAREPGFDLVDAPPRLVERIAEHVYQALLVDEHAVALERVDGVPDAHHCLAESRSEVGSMRAARGRRLGRRRTRLVRSPEELRCAAADSGG